MKKRTFFATACTAVLLTAGFLPVTATSAEIKLVGATAFPVDHHIYKSFLKFKEVFEQSYKGPDKVTFELHHSGSLGSERDVNEFMIQGTAVDFSTVSPAWFGSWSKKITLMEAPFLFRDFDHFKKSAESGALEAIEADAIKIGIRFLGYGGGDMRCVVSAKPINSIDDFPKIRLRVQNSPLHQKSFAATGFVTVPMDYPEVYNAIKAGVVDALDNEAVAVQSMKFYEVAPYFVRTNHQLVVRPLAFSEKRFQSFPKEVQEAILKAGKVAGELHGEIELSSVERVLKELSEKNGMKVVPFDNAEMRKRALPVTEAFAKEIDALDIFQKIQNVK